MAEEGVPKHLEVVVDDVGERLGIGSRAGSAAPDGVVELGELVRYSVGNVGTGRRPRVGACSRLALEVRRGS